MGAAAAKGAKDGPQDAPAEQGAAAHLTPAQEQEAARRSMPAPPMNEQNQAAAAAGGKDENSVEYKCKIYGDCPEGMTPEPNEKYPKHSADYMCKVYGVQCDENAGGTQPAARRSARSLYLAGDLSRAR